MKKLKNKLIIITIVVVLVNFLFAQPVSAKSFLSSVGGKLLEPFCDFFIFVGDSVINALQTNFLTDQRAIIQANSSEEAAGLNNLSVGTVLQFIGGAAATVGGVAITALSGGILGVAGGILISVRRSYSGYSCRSGWY